VVMLGRAGVQARSSNANLRWGLGLYEISDTSVSRDRFWCLIDKSVSIWMFKGEVERELSLRRSRTAIGQRICSAIS
jgi:hypothetical protein